MNDSRITRGGRPVSYRVQVWNILTNDLKHGKTYTVRWAVNGARFRETFQARAAADAYRSELVSAHKRGEPFDTREGKPVSWLTMSPTWFTFACDYVDAKWERLAPNSRRSTGEALTDVTEALTEGKRGAPDRRDLRAVCRDWAFSTRLWGDPLPDRLTPVLAWLERNTAEVATLADPVVARRVLDRLSRRLDGELAAPNTANRKRMVFNNAINHACELALLERNPLMHIQWTREHAATTVNPGVVVNPRQATALLDAMRDQANAGPRVRAFFALLYYAALRPEEAICLTRANLASLPDQGWGEIVLFEAEPRPGSKWTKTRKSREKRQLKHRASGDGRRIPAHPDLVATLRWHIAEYNVPPGGQLFRGPRGGALAEWAYLDVLRKAREAAFTRKEAASVLAGRPYDLRHAAVSTWLNAGVPAPQVAEWAGHSVDVLLRVYAKCVAGQEHAAMRRIQRSMEAMTNNDTTTDDGSADQDEHD